MLVDLVERWQAARRALLVALNDHETWLKAEKRGGQAVHPAALKPLWQELSRAEGALNAWRRTDEFEPPAPDSHRFRGGYHDQ